MCICDKAKRMNWTHLFLSILIFWSQVWDEKRKHLSWCSYLICTNTWWISMSCTLIEQGHFLTVLINFTHVSRSFWKLSSYQRRPSPCKSGISVNNALIFFASLPSFFHSYQHTFTISVFNSHSLIPSPLHYYVHSSTHTIKNALMMFL